MIRGFGTGALTVSQRMESVKVESPKLVFHLYGDEYLLREVWTSTGTGRQLPETRRERELAAGGGGATTASVDGVEIPLL